MEGINMVNILVVEDDKQFNQIVCTYLNNNGYAAKGCLNPSEAYDLMYSNLYSLIISDIMMPREDGFKFAKTIREQNKTIPILFISSLDDFTSKQKGFRLGIDDYMVKPIDMDEMVLRVGALLRRANIANENRLKIGSLELVKDERGAYLDGEEVPISVKEFNILYKLLAYPKKIFTRSELIDEYWGLENDTGLRTVDVYITRLRNKFSKCKDFEIVTVHGFGYKAVVK
jgi:two-component system OmpR family response regulator